MEMTLRLPSSYVSIERDEMEYVDGGGIWANWSGVHLTLSKATCGDLAAILAGAAAVGGLATYISSLFIGTPAVVVVAVATCVLGVGSAYMWYCSNKNGFQYNYNFFSANTWGRI